MTVTEPTHRRTPDLSESTPDAWPGLYDVPTGLRTRVSAAVAQRIFRHATSRLGVTVINGDVTVLSAARADWAASAQGPTMVLHRPDEFFRRVGTDGLIGLGEGYMAGAWDSPDLDLLLTTLAAELPSIVPNSLQRMRRFYDARAPKSHRNSVNQTRDNISHHYDLSNDLFASFLDTTLSYSAGLFHDDTEVRPGHLVSARPVIGSDLDQAQIRKIDRLLDQAKVGQGTRVLEIGTGWGELAIRAAHRGAVVRSVTLSSEQQALARDRVALAGVEDQVSIDLLDYREVDGEYDAIVSVEMIEAVGAEYWPTYFAKIDSLLAPGGRVAIQAITMPHDRMVATRNGFTWINKYIFPGGFLPSTEAIDEVTREHTTLRIADRLSFGSHYAETLRQWDASFAAASDHVTDLGFDEVFARMWHFYLIYSRAGFASGYLDVQQISFSRDES